MVAFERKKSQKRREKITLLRSLPTHDSILPVAIKKIHYTTAHESRMLFLTTYPLVTLLPLFPLSFSPSIISSSPSSDVTDADYMNEHAPPPAPYYPYPALHKEHPTTLAGALACLAGQPMLFSSAPLLSPPDKAGAE